MRFSWLILVALLLVSDVARADSDCGFYAYRAVITDVYDGDTVTADIDLGFHTWRRGERLRLHGIDTPELRGASRPRGLLARDALRKLVLGRTVTLCTIEDRTGKYGRYLVKIFLDEPAATFVNAWLLTEGLAEPYLP